MSSLQNADPVKVFVAYARENEALKDELAQHLAGLQRLGLIKVWHDRLIEPGVPWDAEIRASMEDAQVFLLLISSNFVASDYCSTVEMEFAIKKHLQKKALVVPVIVGHVNGWEEHGSDSLKLGALNALPPGGKPVVAYDDHHEAWASVMDGIRQSIYRLELPASSAVNARQEKGRGFVERLVSADDVAVIGLTNEVLVKYLDDALGRRKQLGKGFWENLTVVFASPEFLKTLPQETSSEGESRDDAIRLEKLRESSKRMTRFLLREGVGMRSNWKCSQYPGQLPFVGSLCRNESETFLRIAMILPGIDQKDAFYIEQDTGHPFFEQLNNTFEYVRENSHRMVEWVLVGDCDGQTFEITGLTRRTHVDGLQGQWAAVILIMLHQEEDGEHYMLLQRRTRHNAADRLDTFSNISGMVTDVDLLRDSAPDKLADYLDANYMQDPSDEEAWQQYVQHAGAGPVKLVLDADAENTVEMFRQAAVRELNEELGLQLEEPGQLEFQCFCPLDRRGPVNLLFGIFSLEVDGDQVETIRARKPYADLQPCSRSRIEKFHVNDSLNLLMQVRFKEVFVPIFKQLGID